MLGVHRLLCSVVRPVVVYSSSESSAIVRGVVGPNYPIVCPGSPILGIPPRPVVTSLAKRRYIHATVVTKTSTATAAASNGKMASADPYHFTLNQTMVCQDRDPLRVESCGNLGNRNCIASQSQPYRLRAPTSKLKAVVGALVRFIL